MSPRTQKTLHWFPTFLRLKDLEGPSLLVFPSTSPACFYSAFLSSSPWQTSFVVSWKWSTHSFMGGCSLALPSAWNTCPSAGHEAHPLAFFTRLCSTATLSETLYLTVPPETAPPRGTGVSVSTASDSRSPGHEFKPHVGDRVFLKTKLHSLTHNFYSPPLFYFSP